MVTIERNAESGFHALATSMFARLTRLMGGSRTPLPEARQVPEPVRVGRKNTGMAMQTLRSSLKAGRITQEEYAARVAQLSESSG